jgi:hypothetical protein
MIRGIISQRTQLINAMRRYVIIPAGDDTMKKRWAVLFAGLLPVLAGAAELQASEEAFSTGKDWSKHMSEREKYISLVPPTMVFEKYDVRLAHSLPQYIGLIDNILLRNPQLGNEDVGSIFASTIYLAEPQNRPALKAMEMDFLSGNYEAKPYEAPRLTVEDLTKEA